jgi:hypothetical protein
LSQSANAAIRAKGSIFQSLYRRLVPRMGHNKTTEPAHSPLALTGRLMRVLRAIVEIPVLPVSNTRHYDPLRCPVAPQLVSNDHSWTSLTGCPQKPAEESDGSETIPLRLDENIKNDTVLIDGPPEVMSGTVDLEEDLIQMPLVARPGTPSPQAIGELASEFIAPAPDRFVAHHHATCRHHLLYITRADAEAEVQPHAFGDDFFRESMTTVWVVRHSFSIPSHGLRST